MLIDKEGVMDIQNIGLKLSPDFTLDELKSNPHFGDFEFLGSNDNYTRYRMANAKIDGMPFFLVIYFYENKISQVGMIYAGFKLTSIEGDDWTKRQEEMDIIKKKQDELLLQEYGATAKKYSWGEIRSILYDRFGYEAIIYIKYK